VPHARLALPIQADEEKRLPHPRGGSAYQLVVFQIAFGPFLIDVLMGCELRSDPIIRRGTRLAVLAAP
jgi:hypothetical protein